MSSLPRLWICIHFFNTALDPHSFFADPDPLIFSHCRSGSRLTKLPYEEFSRVENDKKDSSKVKTIKLVLTPEYLNFFHKILQIPPISFHFFLFFFFLNFSLLDPDSGEKMNADPFGSWSTALVFTSSLLHTFCVGPTWRHPAVQWRRARRCQ